MGVDRHQLLKNITEMDFQPVGQKNGGHLYRLKDLVKAYVGSDEKAERTRKTRAEALKIELANSVRQGELIEVKEISRIVMGFCAGIRAKILASPLPPHVSDSILRDLKSLGERDFKN